MPESAERSAQRKTAAREAARRREAVTMLRISAQTCSYGASVLANGTGPEEARETALFVAGELAVMAAALRRLTRLGPGERRVMALRMVNFGMAKKEIAVRLGVSEATVWNYLAGRRGMGVRPGSERNLLGHSRIHGSRMLVQTSADKSSSPA